MVNPLNLKAQLQPNAPKRGHLPQCPPKRRRGGPPHARSPGGIRLPVLREFTVDARHPACPDLSFKPGYMVAWYCRLRNSDFLGCEAHPPGRTPPKKTRSLGPERKTENEKDTGAKNVETLLLGLPFGFRVDVLNMRV